MKRQLRNILITAVFGIAASCGKRTTTRNTEPCEGVMCTAMFAMITVTIQDSNGQPANLDSFYTLRVSNGEKIYNGKNTLPTASYTVLDDGYQKKLANATDDFYFTGFKNGIKVVNEPYKLSADCCHVSRQSGKESITIP